MSILVDSDIEKLANGSRLIAPFDRAMLQGASYDMRIGRKYIRAGVSREMMAPEPSIRLEPGEFVILSTHETLSLPQDLVGHNGLMSEWAKQGLVCLFGAQIDPGFQGNLFVPVFNAGDGPVLLQFQAPLFTVEFTRTNQPASMNWSQVHGAKRSAGITVQTPSTVRPTLADLARMQQAAQDVQSRLQKLEHKIDSTEVRISSIESQNNFRVQSRALTISVIALVVSIVAADPIMSQIKRWFSAEKSAPTAADTAPEPRTLGRTPQK